MTLRHRDSTVRCSLTEGPVLVYKIGEQFEICIAQKLVRGYSGTDRAQLRIGRITEVREQQARELRAVAPTVLKDVFECQQQPETRVRTGEERARLRIGKAESLLHDFNGGLVAVEPASGIDKKRPEKLIV
jgi:hypothetical protein